MIAAREFDVLTQPLNGFHAIEASAGTGKTFSITLLWLRLLVEQHLRPDQILVTTFTRAATAELQERLLAALRRAIAVAKQGSNSANGSDAVTQIVANAGARFGTHALVDHLEAALSSFDLAPIHTIHGFCQSLIARHSLELGCDPNLELVEDADDLLTDLVSDELMRQAETQATDPSSALQVAKAAVGNPLARILAPVTETQVDALVDACLNPILGRIEQLDLPVRSKNSILRKVELLRQTGQMEKLSETQHQQLGSLVGEISGALTRARQLHDALSAAELHPIALLARDQFSSRKIRASIRTFDDILLTVHQALQPAHGQEGPLGDIIRARFPAAIVDECQDSDSVQIGVFQRLFSRTASFIVIGDPKQSIYRFRGADLSSYRTLTKGASATWGMTRNYRSDAALVESINRLYERCSVFRGGTLADPIHYTPVTAVSEGSRLRDPQVQGPILMLWSDYTERGAAKRDLARQTAVEFRRLLDNGVMIVDRTTNAWRRVRASDLAVLATSHEELAIVRRELLAQNVPCEQAGASLGSVWASDEALDVHAWLTAIAALEQGTDPLKALLAFAATPLVGSSVEELDRLSREPINQARLARELLSDGSALQHQGPLTLLQRFWSDSERLARHLCHRDGERQLTNWRQLGCLLQEEWAHGRRRAGDLALWLSRRRGQDGCSSESLMKLETDLPAVQLATIYAAKGLEYPIVCCPFLWHVGSRIRRRCVPVAMVRRPCDAFIDVGSEDFALHLEESMNQEDEERERVLYVAVTRARHRLYLGNAPVQASQSHDNGAERSALANLLGLESVDSGQWLTRCPVPRLSLDTSQAGVSSPNNDADPPLELAAPPSGSIETGPLTRTTSYSALTRAEDETSKDYDPDDPATSAKEPGLLADLNLSGNRLGQRVHHLLEEILGNGRSLDSVTEHLVPEWRTITGTILNTPIPLGSEITTLWEIRARAIAEMHVLLPIATISPHALSEALLGDPLIAHDAERRAWAEEISTWGFGLLAGFFQGYIDLVFEYKGRFYVVDYKTNALQGYGSGELETAMLHHHYLLQARFYTLALHRHLKATMIGYRPEEHLGGCAYLFVRGFPTQGTWFERASADSLMRLDALFAQATA